MTSKTGAQLKVVCGQYKGNDCGWGNANDNEHNSKD